MKSILIALLFLLPIQSKGNPAYVELGPPNTQLDWANYLETVVFQQLPKAGSGDRTGVVVLNGMYPINRTINIPRHVKLLGKWRPQWHSNDSCGFKATDDFAGPVMLKWNPHRSGSRTHWYSNFGAGMENIFLHCKEGVGGAEFVGSQQASTLDKVHIRYFGSATGLKIAGDTYTIRRLFVDPIGQGVPSQTVEGSIGIQHYGVRLVHIMLESVTVHNCGVGLKLGDATGIHSVNFETETTDVPLLLTYNIRNSRFLNNRFLHSNATVKIDRIRFPKGWDLEITGRDLNARKIILPSGEVHNIPEVYRLHVQDLWLK